MKIDKSKCIGCGTCVGICPVGAIEMKEGRAEIIIEKCIGCHSCMGVCPVDAISSDE